jgi:thiol-disulfide isomerase/thioredoxin
MKAIILLMLSLFLYHLALAQEIEPLKIGDKISNIAPEKFLNDSESKINISKLKGKLIIFDFWNIHCSSCIASMPRMNDLQKQFNGKIQIVYVTKNSKEEVLKLFSRTKIKKPELPFIVGDTILNMLFPHYGDPLHVWIDQEGYVFAITFDYNTNPLTIRTFLDGNNPHLTRRRDFGIDLKYPLVSEQNSNILSLAKNYSILFSGLNEFHLGNSIYIIKDSSSGKVLSIKTINSTLLTLYNLAYDDEIFNYTINLFNLPRNNRIIFKVEDSSDFFAPNDETILANWIKKNVLSYEIKIPVDSERKIFKSMQDDLNRYLPYVARIEKKNMKCLILTRIDTGNFRAIEKNNNIPSVIQYNKDNSVIFKNTPFPAFVRQLIYENTSLYTPIIDETNIEENIDMVFHSKLSNLQSLNIQLRKYGLILKEGDRKIDVLIISDKIKKS